MLSYLLSARTDLAVGWGRGLKPPTVANAMVPPLSPFKKFFAMDASRRRGDTVRHPGELPQVAGQVLAVERRRRRYWEHHEQAADERVEQAPDERVKQAAKDVGEEDTISEVLDKVAAVIK
jgi:hypothetical protein